MTVPVGVAPARRRRSDAAANEQRVRSAAMDVFLERGHAMTMEDVASSAGVSKGTVYNTYANRAALIDETVIRFLRESEVRYREAAANLPAWDALLDIILTPTIGVAATAQMLRSDYPDGPVKRALEQLDHLVSALLERGKREGTIRTEVTLANLKLLFAGLYLALPEYSRERASIAREHGLIILRGLHT